MFKKVGKYVAEKITQSAIGQGVKWGFWTILFMFPGTIITTVGVTGVVAAAATVHSGLIEYGATKMISRKLE